MMRVDFDVGDDGGGVFCESRVKWTRAKSMTISMMRRVDRSRWC